MHETSPTSAHMCELEPPVSTVPDNIITGLQFQDLPVCIKYLQEDFLWEFVSPTRHQKSRLRVTLAHTE